MKYLYLTVFTIFAVSFSNGQSYTFKNHLSGPGRDEFNSVKLCNDGGIIASGNTDSTLVIGTNSLNLTGGFVTKFDSNGNNLWVVAAGDNNTAYYSFPDTRWPLVDVDDSNNVYVLGSFTDTAFVGNQFIADTGSNNLFLAKLNSLGNTIWLKKICDEGRPGDLTFDHMGNIIVTGGFWGTTYFDTIAMTTAGGGGLDIFLAKFTSSGNQIWIKQAGGFGFYSDMGYAVDADYSGNIYVGGHIRTNAYFDALPLACHSAPFFSGFDGFVAKYNTSGNAQWVQYCGYQCHTVSVDSAGNCYAGSYTNGSGYFGNDTVYLSGSNSFYIARFNSSGVFKWVKTNEAGTFSWTLGISADNNGHVYATGLHRDLTTSLNDTVHLESSLCGGLEQNSFILCIDSSGNPLYGKTLQSCTSGSWGSYIDVKDCRIATTGTLRLPSAAVYFDNDSMVIWGEYDGYLAVFDTCLLLTNVHTPAKENYMLTLYPNPVTDVIILKLNNDDTDKINVHVTNAQGEIMEHYSVLKNKNDSELSLPVKKLSGGIYFITVSDGNKYFYSKFIKL
jgi:hypothetical protein